MSDDKKYPPGEVRGSCACGRLAFESTTLPKDVSSCYCRECSKTGCGFLSFSHFLESTIKWSEAPDMWKPSDKGERGFCKQCGSAVCFRYYADKGEVGIVTSMIDHSSSPLPKSRQHIFLQEKAEWVLVPDDDSEKYDSHNPKFSAKLEAYRRPQGPA